ncbi:reverse transcriptase domain-containing protein [Tanacetum coccineum]
MVSGPEDQPPSVNKVEEERIKVAINPEHTQTVMIGSNLTERARAKLWDLLQRNVDVFAWTPKDMTGVPRHVAEYRLNVREGCQPIRQKKRGQAAERNIAINEEVSKLMTAGIMREVHYHDWLSNPMMRLVDRAFHRQIGRNLEVYVDDLVIKSHTEDEVVRDIAKLPMLIAPEEKEELIIYLAASKEAVSVVLMTKREAKQMPIYFVSRALRGPEVNYTSMEKLVLALVHARKRLRRYFQAHPIVVITDQPIKNILSNPEVAGRMQKWSIQLGEFGIHYRPRISVKGKVLADFIMERPEEENPDASAKEEEPLLITWNPVHDGRLVLTMRRQSNTSRIRKG